MPVYLRPDEEMPDAAKPADPGRDRVELLEGFLAGCRASLVCVAVGVILLPLMLLVMRPTLLAADKLFVRGGEHWSDAYMPTVLFAIFGAGFGALLGWRLSASASLGGVVTWLITGAAAVVLTVVGACAATVIFPGGIPTMCWIGLGALGLSALGAMYLFSIWVG